MRKWLIRRVLLPSLLLHAGASLGCTSRSFEDFQYENSTELLRSVSDPLIDGQVRLASALVNHHPESVIFTLNARTARLLEDDARALDMRDASRAVFFRLLDPATGDAAGAAYLDPSTLTLESLEARGGNAWVRSADGKIALFRSIPLRGSLPFTQPRRALHRYDFTLDERRNLAFEKVFRLTAREGWAVAPVVDHRSGNVVYLERAGDARYVLMVTDLEGTGMREVFPGTGFDVRAPRLLPDGRLVFSANAKGYYQLYEMPFPTLGPSPEATTDGAAPRRLHPFSGYAKTHSPGSLLVANTSLEESGKLQVLSLPEEYDLRTIAALVAARNPYVNQKRALLAATLAAAAQRRFDAWPTLDWGIFYTPIVGVFYDDPLISSGDYLSEGISRGIFGLAQPLLDFRRRAALTKADLWRAEIARDAVGAEINRRISEAAEIYFEAQYRRRMTGIYAALVDLAERRVAYFETIRSQSQATRADRLAAEQARDGFLSEAEFQAQRLGLLESRLLELCGMSGGMPLELRDEKFALAEYEIQPLQQLRHVALMNHPDMEAAESALSRAFFEREVGPARHPTAIVSGTYGQSRHEDDFGTVIDDFITLTLQGKYPLGSRQVRRLFNEQWDRTIEALQHERDGLAGSTGALVEEVRMDFVVAQRDYRAKRSALDYRFEVLRVARVHSEYGPPGEEARFDPTVAMAARQEYLLAQSALAEVEFDLGTRFTRLWRALGLAERIPDEAAAWERSAREIGRPSIWLWHTKEAMASDVTLSEFLSVIDVHRPRRIYAYLYSDSLLLQKGPDREKFLTLLQFCEARDVEVWALLGEPEWIESRDEKSVDRAIARILAFNEAQAPLEPKIRGVKLDLEPHSLSGWHDGEEQREALIVAHLALLDRAQAGLAGQLPLWADLSTQYFKPDQAHFLERLLPRLDGATLMCYFPRAERIQTEGIAALDRFGKPLEIGIELSSAAPDDVRVPRMPQPEFAGFMDELRQTFATRSNFSGLALHDYRGILTYFEEGTAVEHDSKAGEPAL